MSEQLVAFGRRTCGATYQVLLSRSPNPFRLVFLFGCGGDIVPKFSYQ